MWQVCERAECLSGSHSISWNAHSPSHIFLFFRVILGAYYEIKENKAWDVFSLTSGFIGIMPTLTQPCVMWTLIGITPMSWSFNLHLMQCKMCQYSFCLVPGLQVLLVGSWELGDNAKSATWVVVNHFEKFPGLFAQQLTGVNIIPQKRPECYIYSGRG